MRTIWKHWVEYDDENPQGGHTTVARPFFRIFVTASDETLSVESAALCVLSFHEIHLDLRRLISCASPVAAATRWRFAYALPLLSVRARPASPIGIVPTNGGWRWGLRVMSGLARVLGDSRMLQT